MTDRPILFSAPMVRAILDGRKTVTRRLVKDAGGAFWDHAGYRPSVADGRVRWHCVDTGAEVGPCSPMPWSPYGGPGDRLWVRETWRYHDWTNDGLPWIAYAADGCHRLCEHVTADWADRVCDVWATLSDPDNYQIDGAARDRKWRSPLFLPRWASRLTLRVTSVRVERLQAITEEDAIAEGVRAVVFTPDDGFPSSIGYVFGDDDGRSVLYPTAREAFAVGWDSINGKRAPWASNPWVWVVGFEVEPKTKPNEDRGPTRPLGAKP